MTGLTQNDLTILIEALDAWVKKDQVGNLLSDVMGAVLLPHGAPEEQVMAMRTERQYRRQQSERDQAYREEVATLLKARLFTMRREMDAAGDVALGAEKAPVGR